MPKNLSGLKVLTCNNRFSSLGGHHPAAVQTYEGLQPIYCSLAYISGLSVAGSPAYAAPDKAARLKATQADSGVIVHGTPGRHYEKHLSRGFEESHSGIRDEYSGTNNRTAQACPRAAPSGVEA